jgi:hypothetical protein
VGRHAAWLGTHLSADPLPQKSAPAGAARTAEDGRTRVVLLACVSGKRAHPAPAQDLYVSAWFVKARSFAMASGRPWFILSAMHGLVRPGEILAPYEASLNAMPVAQRRAWAERVATKLHEAAPGLACATLLAGARYRELLQPHLAGRGVTVEVPMAGLRIGEQLRWLNRRGTN